MINCYIEFLNSFAVCPHTGVWGHCVLSAEVLVPGTCYELMYYTNDCMHLCLAVDHQR